MIVGLGNFKEGQPVKQILRHYSKLWPNDRKESLINRLAHDGFFRHNSDSALSAFQAMSLIAISYPSTNFVLQLDVQPAQLAEYISRLNVVVQRSLINGLEEYLELTLDGRKIQLESCDFFNRADVLRYVKDDNKIESLIREIAIMCNLAPGDAFFRNRRPTFINDTIEASRQGFVSSENAAMMIAAHVGDRRLR